VYGVAEAKTISVLAGHENTVSKVMFNPQGKKLLTCSEDCSAKLWDLEGQELQTLVGHTDEIFSSIFNYHGDVVITCGKDNSCIIWKDVNNYKEDH